MVLNFNRILLVIAILTMVFVPTASAHSVHMDVIEKSVDKIKVKAYYGGGDPMKDAEVKVYLITENDEEPYIEDKSTDENGIYSFEPQQGHDVYKLVASDFGHQVEKKVRLDSQSSSSSKGSSSNGDTDGLPMPARIVSGFGYIAGIAGIGMMANARKIKKKYENENE
ncbi:hypothetical protein [Methanohalobium sp.]|uniref:hypothetical protein n=1 Tax=Methanohalobium sp. TaxID=2837493 RepID=UPI0025DD49F7|nr:hypothetical protein [Methanohalobium sp.]